MTFANHVPNTNHEIVEKPSRESQEHFLVGKAYFKDRRQGGDSM